MIDRITFFISSLQLPWLTPVAIAINNDFIFLIILGLLVLAAEKRIRKKRILLILLIFILSYITAVFGKELFSIERPCRLGIESKIPCPENFSYPSGHVLFASAIMMTYIKRREFLLFWLFTFFVAFTRLYLGVHTLEDVIASLALSPLVYHVSYSAVRWKYEK